MQHHTHRSDTIRRRALAGFIAATAMLGGAAEAASSYDVTSFGTLTLNLAQPESLALTWTAAATPQTLETDSGSPSNVASFTSAEAFAGGFVEETGNSVFGYGLDIGASGQTIANVPGTSSSVSSASGAEFKVTLQNVGSMAQQISGNLAYGFTIETAIDDASFDSSAVELFMALYPGEGLFTAAPENPLFYYATISNANATSGQSADFNFGFTLAAGETKTLTFITETFGDAVSMAPVPVPAALPLLASALVGGAVIGRKRSA